MRMMSCRFGWRIRSVRTSGVQATLPQRIIESASITEFAIRAAA
jgi:hypothetical protein